jgi:hypothetical protein
MDGMRLEGHMVDHCSILLVNDRPGGHVGLA